jgi:hypothetical protein
MAGETSEPQITADDVYQVARTGSRVWRAGAGGRTWRLTREDLLAIDEGWDGSLDELSPLVARAIAAALNREQPWRWQDPDDGGDNLDGALAWADGIDTGRPSASRVYDHLLGGSHNFAVDRDLAQRLLVFEPRAGEYARTNRAFLHRAVRFLLAAGVYQFLDLGSGIPTVGNVHEVAQRQVPGARVVYVDIDPIAVAHSRLILAGNPYATAIEADLRHPEVILNHPELRRVIDLAAPVALLMMAVLHFVPDEDDPAGIVAIYRRALAARSYLAVSHACPPETATPETEAALDAYKATATPLTLRTRQQVAALLDGWRLVPPGLVNPGRWRPDEEDLPKPVPGVAAVGQLDEPGDSPDETGTGPMGSHPVPAHAGRRATDRWRLL